MYKGYFLEEIRRFVFIFFNGDTNLRLFPKTSAIFILLVFIACAPKIMVYHDEDSGEVFISKASIYEAVPPFEHPVKISEETVAKMMRSIKCEGFEAFSEEEIKEYAEKIAKAFRKCRTDSFVSFYISEKQVRNISGGEVYIKQGKVLWYFYPASEVYQRSPVVSDRMQCLGGKRYSFTLSGEESS